MGDELAALQLGDTSANRLAEGGIFFEHRYPLLLLWSHRASASHG
ncbi:MAG: hypothetical protein ACOY0T_40085 [Myxococcota bacterium]